MKPPQEERNRGAPSLRGLQGRSATGLNGQAAKDEVSAVWRGLDAGKYFWRSGREKGFSLDIPFYRTSRQQPGLASSVGRCFERRQLPLSPCFGRNPQRGHDGSQPNLSLRASIQPTLPRH